jgi:PIN like domain
MIDENLPQAMAKALAALFVGEHHIIHLRGRFGPGVKDTEWIAALSAEGQWVVISGDRRIARNKAEQQAFKSSKLVGFFLSPSLQRAKLTKQMERLMALWETIEKQAALVSGGAMFELQMKSNRLGTM